MPMRSSATNIDDYIAEFPPATQERLQEMRGLIRSFAPEATETISYAIPTFDMNGKHLVHFAGYAHHVGFYPTGRGAAAFPDEIAAYQKGKGTLQFALEDPFPVELIKKIVEFRVADVNAKKSK